MAKNCIYCNAEIDDNSVLDVCARCGHGVWGEKMFKAIIKNMEDAKTTGNLEQGSISNSWDKPINSKFAKPEESKL